MKIGRGRIPTGQRIVLYGVEGVGKTTFAAQFPFAVFSDTEGSTLPYDNIDRLDPDNCPIKSYQQLKQQVNYVLANPNCCSTYVIDTFDWAERLICDELCAKYKWTSMDTLDYGKGYTYLYEEVGRLLDVLTSITETGVNVILNCHSNIRKSELPEEFGAYDRWELKLQKKVAALVKEWADLIFFANYKTEVLASSGDFNKKSYKATGGTKRVMYTERSACWDGKNRFNLPMEVPFEYNSIAHIFTGQKPVEKQDIPETEQPTMPEPTMPEPDPKIVEKAKAIEKFETLLHGTDISVKQIQQAVEEKGFYPKGTDFFSYDIDFINGMLIAQFDALANFIRQKGIKDE
jgi:hypothetical protein